MIPGAHSLPPPSPATGAPSLVRDPASAWRRFGYAVALLTLAWSIPLLELIRLALRYDLYSHVLLVPAVSAYLVWIERTQLPPPDRPAWPEFFSLALGMVGCVTLAAGIGFDDRVSRLAVWVLGYVLGIAATGSLVLGRAVLRHCLFAFAFLIFLVPTPDWLVQSCEVALQHASAEVADWFFIATRTPSLRDGRFFQLPGLYIEVAQECSGFRSSLVLFIVSLVAAKMFLRTGWKRAVLVLSGIPLGIARNAFRIYTLAALSIHVDPQIMHSALHKKGGPLFFALSLIPLNLLLWVLYRSDRTRPQSTPSPTSK